MEALLALEYNLVFATHWVGEVVAAIDAWEGRALDHAGVTQENVIVKTKVAQYMPWVWAAVDIFHGK